MPAAAAFVVALLPLAISPYAQDLVVRIAIYAIFALSLELIVGAAGLVSLGHAAFLGIGAYVTVLASGDSGASLALLVPLAIGAAALYALAVGALSLRTRGVYFIMVTLAFAQMAYFVVHDNQRPAAAATASSCTRSRRSRSPGERSSISAIASISTTPSSPRWSRPTPLSPSCFARASAMRSPASGSTSSACAPPASRRRRTSSPPSSSPARSPASRDCCSR